MVPSVMRLTRILALTGLSLPLLGTANADIETSISAGYSSEYLYRGTSWGDDLFDASIDVSGSGNLGGLGDVNFSAGLWIGSLGEVNSGGVALLGLDPTQKHSGNEMRTSLSASKALSDNLDLAVGVTNYSYFGAASVIPDYLEPYIGVGTSLGGIDLGLALHFNEGGSQAHDTYWEFTAGYEMELSGNMTLGLSAVIGHWDEVNHPAPEKTYYGFSVGLSIAASDSITVTPHISHTIDGNQPDGTTGDETVAGVNVSFGF